MTYRAIDLATAARTLWGECEGEPQAGKEAVAWVMRNRVEHPCWWSREKGDGIEDDTIEAVCVDPWQFSCWKDAKRLAKMQALTTDNEAFRQCLIAVAAVFGDLIADPTGGACHYHAVSMDPYPSWTAKLQRSTKIGNHVFYIEKKDKA